jgi:DNA-binding MarR family transcriptional regulator
MAEDVPGASLLFELFSAGQRVRSLLASAMADAPLTPDEYAVYSVLVDEGPSTPTAMARAVGMPPTTMSHHVRAMATRGHVERQRNPGDGRSALLGLTSAGRGAHATAAAAFREANLRFLAALPMTDAEVRDALHAVGAAADTARDELATAALRAVG